MKKCLFLMICLLAALSACKGDDTPAVHVHEFGSWSVERPVSCTQEELLKRTCACGETQTQAGQPVSEHQYDWQVQQALSCISEEIRLGTCADCKATTTQKTPATGVHTYDAKGQCTGCTRKVSVGFTYELSEDGKSYTITGKGSCKDQAVTIPESYMGIPVTAIGPSAFNEWTDLQSIRLPESITKIGTYAFSMTGLTEIILPPGLEVLEQGILAGTQVKTLTLPEGLKTVNKYALMGQNLDRLVLPDSLTEIGEDALYMCRIGAVEIGSGCDQIAQSLQDISRLLAVQVREDNGKYKAEDGVLFTKDGKTLLLYPNGRSGQSYTVPETVTAIAAGAFGDCAGTGNELREIILPSGLVKIESRAFAGCYYLKNLQFRGTLAQWEAVKKDTGWDAGISYTVVCTDGEFKPEG